ncbi:hypothetical protein STAR110904_00175 [Staphylococcus argensis]
MTNHFLFTGDFFCFEGDKWHTVILPSSNREASLNSLQLIRDLDFDVLVPWVSIKGESPVYFVKDEEEKQKNIQCIIDRVRDGANS